MTHEQQSTRPDPQRPFGTPQQRMPVAFDPESKGLRIGEQVRRVEDPSQPNQVYGAYLALLYAVRGAKPGEQLKFRTADLEALLLLVGDDPETIAKRLIALMGCTADEAEVLGGILLRHRRKAAALGVAASLLFGGSLALAPAASASGPTAGICNGVSNQLAHRGNVQPNLLKAAARQNAEAIAKLQAERAVLVTQQATLAGQIAAAEKQIADLDAANAKLDGAIAAAEMLLTKMTEDRATLGHGHQGGRGRADDAAGTAHHAGQPDHPAADQLTDAQKTLAGLNTQKAGVESSLVTKRGELATATTRLSSATAAATTAQNAVNAQLSAIEDATEGAGRAGRSG
jgi:hypothetical protein